MTVAQQTQGNRQSVPASRPLGRRSTIFLRQTTSNVAVLIGGEGVNSSEGYPLAENERLRLPATANLQIYSIRSAGGVTDPGLSILEID